jgi:hypothetical protein
VNVDRVAHDVVGAVVGLAENKAGLKGQRFQATE